MPVLSSKPYNAGDVVFKCKPLLFVVNTEFMRKHCDNCLKRSDQLKKCSNCLKMYYCSKNCQKNDWKNHKNECHIFVYDVFQRDHNFDKKILLTLRLYLRMKSDPKFATQRHPLMNGSDMCLNDIDVQPLKDSTKMNGIFLSISSLYQRLDIDLDVNQMYTCFALINQSSFLIPYYGQQMSDFREGIASALMIDLIPMRHSCLPNTEIASKGVWREVRAMKSIAVGEEITYSVVSLAMNRTDRQRDLKDFLIDCECDKCVNHLDKNTNYRDIGPLVSPNGLFLRYPFWINQSHEFDPKFLDSLETVFGNYHSLITFYLLMRLMFFYAKSPSVTKSMLKNWYEKVERHLLVTHGSDHPWYTILRTYNPN